MKKVYTDLMLPMIAGLLPDFRPVFERYLGDLKREAERMKTGKYRNDPLYQNADRVVYTGVSLDVRDLVRPNRVIFMYFDASPYIQG